MRQKFFPPSKIVASFFSLLQAPNPDFHSHRVFEAIPWLVGIPSMS
jgi:hypothetical protein